MISSALYYTLAMARISCPSRRWGIVEGVVTDGEITVSRVISMGDVETWKASAGPHFRSAGKLEVAVARLERRLAKEHNTSGVGI